MKFTFKPMLQEFGYINGVANIETLSKETPVFSAGIPYTEKHGGDITNSIVDNILNFSYNWSGDLYPTIDTRVQRLMPGMFPSIPGWHCDDVPRAGYFEQPDLTKVRDDIFHYTTLVSTEPDISNTEFVTEDFTVDLDPNSQVPIWKQVHKQIEVERPRTKSIKPGFIYKFNQTTLHRATVTLKRGWRMFFRLSLRTKPPIEGRPSNMQVYLLSEENGW